jgi:hypothetical protein
MAYKKRRFKMKRKYGKRGKVSKSYYVSRGGIRL